MSFISTLSQTKANRSSFHPFFLWRGTKSLTILDKRVMKALALKSGVIKASNQPTCQGFGLFTYKERLFLARGHSRRLTDGFIDPEGYISYTHLSLHYFEVDRYIDLMQTAAAVEVEILARVRSHKLIWRVFKYMYEKTAWYKYHPHPMALLKEAVQIVEKAVLCEKFSILIKSDAIYAY